MGAQTFLARIVPQGDPQNQVFRVTAIDPSLGIWPGPGGELPPYPDIGLPGPQPPFPGGGGGQPPYPSTGPGFRTNPLQLPPWAGKPQPPWGGGGGGGGPGTQVTMIPLPPADPPVPPPTGIPAGSVQVLVFYPGERYPAVAWVQPSPSSGPVQPPAGGEGGAQPPA